MEERKKRGRALRRARRLDYDDGYLRKIVVNLDHYLITRYLFPHLERLLSEVGIEVIYKPVFVDLISRNSCMMHFTKSFES